jgi:glyoxylase-like metal-dependent hydrolase (beta-lactamase superfamily II)
MKSRARKVLTGLLAAAGILGLALGTLALVGVAVSDHPVTASRLGAPVPAAKMEALLDVPGPIEVETVVGATWQVDRGGLINLDHPEAKAAGLRDGLEPIQIYLHVLRHPQRGTYLVDTGVERALRDDPERAVLRGLVAKAMRRDLLHVERDTASVVQAERGLAGVLLTHLHLDHLSGLPDVPRGTPIYAGPGETSDRSILNAAVKGTTDRELAGHAPIQEWRFTRDPDGRFAGVLDVFADGSLFAIWVPGHTPGSTAYLARTPAGPVLLVGDTCHTAWGWEHGVEPGTFTRDRKKNAESLARLRALAQAHPGLSVRLGHQRLH